MSALGQKQTSGRASRMSALFPKADICMITNVSIWSVSDRSERAALEPVLVK